MSKPVELTEIEAAAQAAFAKGFVAGAERQRERDAEIARSTSLSAHQRELCAEAIESQEADSALRFPVQCYNCDHKYKAAVQASLAPTCPKCGKMGAMPQEVEK